MAIVDQMDRNVGGRGSPTKGREVAAATAADGGEGDEASGLLAGGIEQAGGMADALYKRWVDVKGRWV